MTSATATRLLIHGQVQGVGYRAWFAREAERRGLSGWVRNRRTGSVEALLFAEEHALAELIAACRSGPPLARVSHIDIVAVEPGEAGDPLNGIERRPTV
jgi:acylphosphatase